MTHIQNIPHILRHGITHISSAKRNKLYVAIGDGSLINARNSFSLMDGKTLGDYIPFYFAPRMPMLYVMQRGFNGVTPVSPNDIVYCITSIGAIQEEEIDYIFTDGHAVDGFTEFYTPSDVKRIDKIIDKNAINCKYWKDENDLDLKRRKEAEFLVEGDIPITALTGFAVHDAGGAQRIRNMRDFGNRNLIIRPDYYF